MPNDSQEPRNYAVGPEGNILTLENLPVAGDVRWTARRKAEIVIAVRGGLITLADVSERYNIGVDEYLAWQEALDHPGIAGLRTLITRWHCPELSA